MKFRNFIIVLLAVLMAFAFASCKHEPKVDPQPAATKVYKLTATTGRNTSWNGADKFTLHWAEEVEVGDILSLKFRSTSEFTQFSIRNDNCAWVYEQPLTALTSLELGDDGWYTLTYQFSSTFLNGEKTAPTYPTTTKDFRIDFRGNILEDDYIEIKDVKLSGDPLEIEAENVYTHSQAYGAVNPTLEVIDDHAWTVPETHVVFFATEKPGDSALPFDYERVAKGAAFQTDLTKKNYTYTLYSDDAFTVPFAADTPITADGVIYVKYVGDPKTVTFMDGETVLELEPTTVAYGSTITAPAAPAKDDKLFRAWCLEDGVTPFDFTAPVEANVVLYARYEDPITVTFVADGGVPAPEAQKILSGATATKPATDPEKDNYEFLGWFVSTEDDAAAFNFTTAITTDTPVYAKYREAQKFTVTFNLNYAECPEAETKQVYDGNKVAQPDDPEREGFIFDKWTVAAAAESDAYDFDTAVTADLPLYAQWITPIDVTLNFNDGVSENEVVKVAPGTALDEPEAPVRGGYRFDGWFTEEAGGTEVDFTATVSEAKTIFAHWTEAIVKLTADKGRNEGWDSYDKFELHFDRKIDKGDTLTVVYRVTRPVESYNIRNVRNGFNPPEIRWVYESSNGMTINTDENGWTTATYTFGLTIDRGYDPSTGKAKSGVTTMTDADYDVMTNVEFHVRGTIVKGDYMEIKEILWNGEALDITSAAKAALGHSGDVVQKEANIEVIPATESTWTGATTYYVYFYADPTQGSGTDYSASSKLTGLGVAVDSGALVEKPADPVRDGFVFAGWCKSKTYVAEDMWDFENDTVTKNRMLYAIWTPAE